MVEGFHDLIPLLERKKDGRRHSLKSKKECDTTSPKEHPPLQKGTQAYGAMGRSTKTQVIPQRFGM